MRILLPLLLLPAGCAAPSGVDPGRVAALEEDLDEALAANAALEARIAALEAAEPPTPYDDTTLVDGLGKLETRVAANETGLAPIAAELESLAGADTDHDQRLGALEAQLPTLSAELSGVAKSVDDNADNHDALADLVDPTQVQCPSGMLESALGGFCYDETPNEAKPHWGAALACLNRGAHLCSGAEWMAACLKNQSAFDGPPEMADDFVGGVSASKLMAKGGNVCEGATADTENGDATHPFRCCRDKANLVYGSQPDM